MLKDKKGKRKKLCIVGPRSIGGAEGGIENQMYLLLPYFSKVYDCVVYVDKRYEEISKNNVKGLRNVDVIGIKVPFSKPFHKIYLSLRATLDIFKKKPDIAYFNGFGSCLFLPLLGLIRRTKVIVHVRSYDILYPDWNIFGKMLFGIILLFVRWFADKVIVVNPLFARLFSRGYNKEVYWLENAAVFHTKKVDGLKEEFEKKYGFFLDKEYVLFIGRITPFKNVELLIKAFAKLNDKRYFLLIAGNIDDKKYYRKLQREIPKELRNNVVFLGKVDKKYIPLLYMNAKCKVLPSLFEGMPNVVMESCVYDTPTYVSKIVPHLSLRFLKKDAFFSDVDELSKKLRECKKTCDKEYIKRNLAPSKISKKIIEVFEDD